jgi:hypothetical protein
MNLIEAIILGSRGKRLKNPITFTISLVLFLILFGLSIIYALVIFHSLTTGTGGIVFIFNLAFATTLFILSYLTGRTIKRCVQ